jgi:hypothetical protein
MCTKRKRITLLLVAGLLVALTLFVQTYAVPPRAWRQIQVGDTPEQVRAKWPTVVQDLQDIKGDFCYHRVPLGIWRLQIFYGADHRVSEKFCSLRLGTRDCFKEF